jgi:hypothetical protein
MSATFNMRRSWCPEHRAVGSVLAFIPLVRTLVCPTLVLVLLVVEHVCAQSLGPSELPVTVPLQPSWSSCRLCTAGTELLQQAPGKSSAGRRDALRRGSSRVRSLFLTANLTGGYDDNLGTPVGSGTGSVPAAPTSGSSAFADAMLDYSRGSASRRISIKSLGSVQMYPNHLEDPAAAGKARLSGHARFDQRDTLRFSTQLRFEPLFATGVGEELENPAELVDATAGGASHSGAPTIGLIQRRSLVSSNKAYFERVWSRRDKTVVAYLYFNQHITSGGVGRNSYHQGAIEHRRTLGRTTNLSATYQYMRGEQLDASDVNRPNETQSLTAGPGFAKALPGRRQLSVSMAAGATRVQQVHSLTGIPIDGWMPTASAFGNVDLTRTWSVNGRYGRGFSMLQGLTGEFYATDQVKASIGGALTSRSDVVMGLTYANGRTLVSSGVSETFTLSGATLQLRVALSSKIAATATYYLYSQRYSNSAALPEGFPARYDRNAVLVGLTFWAPLAGTRPAQPRAAGDW